MAVKIDPQGSDWLPSIQNRLKAVKIDQSSQKPFSDVISISQNFEKAGNHSDKKFLKYQGTCNFMLGSSKNAGT